MDTLINKLKSTVADVIPGNPLSGDFDINTSACGSAGPNLVWNIYDATKKNTKQLASVFVFEKRSLEKFSKDDKKKVLETLKRGAQQLARLRHPKILSVLHPLEENRECLAFATERVVCSLANTLGRQQSNPDTGNAHTATLDDVEVGYGLLQVVEALSFLHCDAKIVHGSISPASIVLNDKHMWKLMGFEFHIPRSTSSPSDTVQFDCPEWRPGQVELVQPSLDYLAPEWGQRSICDSRSDLFSLGVTLHALYNQGKPIFQSHGNLSAYKQHVTELKSFKASLLMKIPVKLHETFRCLISLDPQNRPDAKQISKVSFFDDIAIMTLVYIDSLVQRDNLQKSQFFKSLPNVMRQIPMSLCLFRVLPLLFDECSNVDMIPFVLNNILIIADCTSKAEYSRYIFPRLAPVMRFSQPIQIPLLFMQNMQLLLEKTSERDTKAHILPMLFNSLDVSIDNVPLQELCLNVLPNFSHLVDKHSMETSLIPRIKKLCTTSVCLSTKVLCLLCIGKMMGHMEKWFVLDVILPFLAELPSREPAIVMSMLGIYKLAFTNKNLGIPKDHLATKALPFLVPLSVTHSLTRAQFSAFMGLIKEMLKVVEDEHSAKLEQDEQKDTESKSLSFSAGNEGDSKMMNNFLAQVALQNTNADHRTSSNPGTALTAGRTSTKETDSLKVKDLTATLGSMKSPILSSSSAQSQSVLQPEMSRFARSASGVEHQSSPSQRAHVTSTSNYPPHIGWAFQTMTNNETKPQPVSETAGNQSSSGPAFSSTPVQQYLVQKSEANGQHSAALDFEFGLMAQSPHLEHEQQAMKPRGSFTPSIKNSVGHKPCSNLSSTASITSSVSDFSGPTKVAQPANSSFFAQPPNQHESISDGFPKLLAPPPPSCSGKYSMATPAGNYSAALSVPVQRGTNQMPGSTTQMPVSTNRMPVPAGLQLPRDSKAPPGSLTNGTPRDNFTPNTLWAGAAAPCETAAGLARGHPQLLTSSNSNTKLSQQDIDDLLG